LALAKAKHALNTINDCNSVASKMGQTETDAFSRLHLVPGLQHGRGGPERNHWGRAEGAPDPQHHIELALEPWGSGDRGDPMGGP
jgi:hypothetical protein